MRAISEWESVPENSVLFRTIAAQIDAELTGETLMPEEREHVDEAPESDRQDEEEMPPPGAGAEQEAVDDGSVSGGRGGRGR